MAAFRKLLFWMHLAGGVVAGLVILLMSVTGVLLTYEKQIVAYYDQSAAGTPAFPGRLGIETIVQRVQEGSNAVPTSVTISANPTAPLTVSMGREAVLVDPSIGRVAAPQASEVRQFFRTVTEWHRWLGATVQGRDNARAVTGAANLIFLFLVVSGLYLWCPRRWAWTNLRAVLWFRGGLAGKARDFNWHNVAGFWACVPLFIIVLSGVVMSYPWANNLVYTANGVKPPTQGKGKAGPPRSERARTLSTANLDVLLVKAQRQNPEWKRITVQLPATDESPVTFAIDAGTGGQPQKRSTLTLARSGEVMKYETFADQDAGRRARSWMRFAHTGEYYGIAGQTIAGIASAGGAVLVWTGLALAFRRLRAYLSRQRFQVPEPTTRIAA